MTAMTQAALAFIITVALGCATVLTIYGHVGLPVALVIFAAAGLFLIGGIDNPRRKKVDGDYE